MNFSEQELLQRAQENVSWMFSEEEIAILCNVPQVIVGRVKAEPDGPFFMDRCRPEWFVEWMRRHPGFHISNDPAHREPSNTPPKAPLGANPWADARRHGGGSRER